MKKPLGRTQKIAIVALAVPFLTITVALFLGKATVDEWSSFLQFFFPSLVVPLIISGAAVKMKAPAAPPTPPDAPGEAQT